MDYMKAITLSPTPFASQEVLLLTIKQAAAILQIGRNRLYEMVETKEILSFRIGNKIMIPRLALEQWIEERLSLEHDLAV